MNVVQGNVMMSRGVAEIAEGREGEFFFGALRISAGKGCLSSYYKK